MHGNEHQNNYNSTKLENFRTQFFQVPKLLYATKGCINAVILLRIINTSTYLLDGKGYSAKTEKMHVATLYN